MKKNREKLTDAFGMLREDTLADGVVDTYVPHRAAIRGAARRRVALVAAACMTFALLTAALVALPFLRADEPATQPPITNAPPVSEFELAYYDAPLVNIQVLALSSEDARTELEVPKDQDVAMVFGNNLIDNQVYICFDAEVGETVTATSQNALIVKSWLSPRREDKQFYPTLQDKLANYVAHGMNWVSSSAEGAHEVVLGASDAELETQSAAGIEGNALQTFLRWGGNRYYSPANLTPDEDFIDFVIRDENGRITGAGCVYLGNRKLINNTESRYYDIVSITRGTVLGSVRFENPDDVTEEQVAAYLESLHEKSEGIRETLFDNLNLSERLSVALADIINTRYDAYDNFGMSYGCCAGDTYMDITVYGNKNPGMEDGSFLLLEDGTWGEIKKIVDFCEYCGEHKINPSNPGIPCNHWGFWHTRYKLTDGRIFDAHDIFDAGSAESLLVNLNDHISRLVLVTDTTYTTPTAAEVIADLLPFDASMEGVVSEAFLRINEAMGGDAMIDDAVQSFAIKGAPIDLSKPTNPLEWEKIWDRYAILSVREGRLGALHNYLVLEDGTYVEYGKVRYECEECGYSTTNHTISEDHEYDAGHSEATQVFFLKDGGTYTVRSGLTNDQAHAPVYDPNGQ